MASTETYRIELTRDEVDALSWAAWFASPASPQYLEDALAAADDKLRAKRKQILQPRATREERSQPLPATGSVTAGGKTKPAAEQVQPRTQEEAGGGQAALT